jgi:hypothetical protein
MLHEMIVISRAVRDCERRLEFSAAVLASDREATSK